MKNKVQKIFLTATGFLLLASQNIFITSATNPDNPGNDDAQFAPSPPDEGMWLLMLVQAYNYEKMNQMGCTIPANKIYSETEPSLKDAIVQLGGFCTAEFVSDQGLLLTNHHCGYDAIAEHSTVEHNYLDNGFWAMKPEDELKNEGLTVSVLMRMQDVTDSIVPLVKGMDQAQRVLKLQGIIKGLTSRAATSDDYRAEVKSMFSGNQYFLFVYEVFRDVRLVGAPPQSIGRFGGDTDNWMWPRHTGDFSMLRVYCAPDGSPADYSKDNIPYKPKYHLPVSLKGFAQNDFTMIMGFPGMTNRYLSSFALKEIMEVQNPTNLSIFKIVTDAQREEMNKNDSVRILLSSDYASIENSVLLFGGQQIGMKKNDVVGVKQKEEEAFSAWLELQGDSIRGIYGKVLKDLQKDYEQVRTYDAPLSWNFSALNWTTAGKNYAAMSQLIDPLGKKDDPDGLKSAIADVIESLDANWKGYWAPTEKMIWKNFLPAYLHALSKDDEATYISVIGSKAKNSDTAAACRAWVESTFAKSILLNKSKLDAFLKKPSLTVLQTDPFYFLCKSLEEKGTSYRSAFQNVRNSINKHNRIYLGGRMLMSPNTKWFPDANFSERLTYGKILDYNPRDGVHYQFQTYLKGVMEKENPSNTDFIVPEKLKQLWIQKDFGDYGANGDLPVCFLSNNDITGGNSGSPVMNGAGELIGIAFDGDYEGTAGDYVFDESVNRTISVDIRYVLFIIDKFAGCTRLIQEMDISK